MAVSISFFLVYSKEKIKAENLQETPITVRAQVRFTRSGLNWSGAKRAGHKIYRLQFTTPARVFPRWWANGKVKHSHPNAGKINAIIDSIAQRSTMLHEQYLQDGRFPDDKEFILSILDAYEAKGPDSTLLDYYASYATYLREKGTANTTCARQEAIIRHLKKFQKDTGYQLTFESINKTFSTRFLVWCEKNLTPKRKNQDFAGATVPRYLKDMRNFLNHAYTEGWTNAVTWRQIKSNIKQKNIPITLSSADIERLWKLTVSDLLITDKDTSIRKAQSAIITRDWFLFGTQTAMRWSDWRARKYKFEKVQAGYNLQFTQEKTDNPLEIPVSTLALQILEKYNFDMPPVFSPGVTTTHLALLTRAASITKRITSHAARRTFCTLQEAAGVPRGVIMRITGHRTEKDYLRYTGITYKVNADMLRRANPDMFENAG